MLLGDTDHAPDGCDIETYLAMLDSVEMSDAEKRNFIHTLQTLIETVIGIRFGVDPATLELNARASKLASKSQAVIDSNHPTQSRLEDGFSAASMATRQPDGGANEHIQE